MPPPIKGSVGITPTGALGVSLFYHLTQQLQKIDGRVFFLERQGSPSCATLRQKGELLIADARTVHHLPTQSLFKPNLLASFEATSLPEVLLVCPNPDQLLGVISEYVALMEAAYEAGELETLPLPVVVLCSNGIYFQRIRQIYIEKIEEATLLGRLPDLWPDLMPRIVGRLLRGVTIQTAVREGSGPGTIYRPGPRGITRIAGGDAISRERACALLAGLGGWFELAAHSSATRLEFDKAMVNLASNLLGQLYAIDDSGNFTLLRINQIIVPEHEPEIRNLCLHVFAVGRAVRAYEATDEFDALFERLKLTLQPHASHTPSSLQWIALRLRTGSLDLSVPPTEAWLLDPLIRYARSAQLDEAVQYFEDLKERLLEKLRRLAGTAGLHPAAAS
ncbi:MAG TPA: hypothetical protein VKM56_04810 [Verrucomicrobiae bacterium]|nr:hypothetical protein [Verrucomicrobiae bacterium]